MTDSKPAAKRKKYSRETAKLDLVEMPEDFMAAMQPENYDGVAFNVSLEEKSLPVFAKNMVFLPEQQYCACLWCTLRDDGKAKRKAATTLRNPDQHKDKEGVHCDEEKVKWVEGMVRVGKKDLIPPRFSHQFASQIAVRILCASLRVQFIGSLTIHFVGCDRPSRRRRRRRKRSCSPSLPARLATGMKPN